jgi:hypothetical protein
MFPPLSRTRSALGPGPASCFAPAERELDALRQLRAAAEYIQLRADAQQEDHGKAILALIIVTVVFLSLSFVSSVFGMNTIDMGELRRAQWFFWAAALPLMAFVLAGALAVGFRDDAMREALADWVQRRGVGNGGDEQGRGEEAGGSRFGSEAMRGRALRSTVDSHQGYKRGCISRQSDGKVFAALQYAREGLRWLRRRAVRLLTKTRDGQQGDDSHNAV